MGIEGNKKYSAEEQIAKMRNDLAGKRAAREIAASDRFIGKDIEGGNVGEKIALGTEKVSISDFETLIFTTKSGNKFVLQKDVDGYTITNIRENKSVHIDSLTALDLSLQLGERFNYGKYNETTEVVSGGGILLKK